MPIDSRKLKKLSREVLGALGSAAAQGDGTGSEMSYALPAGKPPGNHLDWGYRASL